MAKQHCNAVRALPRVVAVMLAIFDVAQAIAADAPAGAAARVVPSAPAPKSAASAAPGPVERSCAPWDGAAIEFAAKAGDSWLIAAIWKAPRDLRSGRIDTWGVKIGSVRICRDRAWSGPDSCRVAKQAAVTLSTARDPVFAGSIEADGLRGDFAGRLPAPQEGGHPCG